MTCSVFWVDRAFHRTWRMVQPCLVQLINLPLSKCNVRLFFGTVIIISYFFKSPWYFGPSVKGLAYLSWSLSVFRGNYKAGSKGSWPLWPVPGVACPVLTQPGKDLQFPPPSVQHKSAYPSFLFFIFCRNKHDWEKEIEGLSGNDLAWAVCGTN